MVGNEDKVSSSKHDHSCFGVRAAISYNRPMNLVEQKTKLVHPIILTHLQRHIVIEEIQNEGIQMNAMVRAVAK